ncbi:MAG TPA: ribosome-associated translation inhibitor RaiA [Acidimicrobiia bacterium]|nr:ribosome-associated translation inhibitor RaiA [Acidimicrobiia bacterium]
MTVVDIVVNARHTEVSPQLRETARKKVAQLERFASDARRIEVEFSDVASRSPADAHTCEILVHLKGELVKGVASASEHPAALDLAFDKVRQQMRKRHERRSGGLAAARRRSASAAGSNGSAPEPGESD